MQNVWTSTFPRESYHSVRNAPEGTRKTDGDWGVGRQEWLPVWALTGCLYSLGPVTLGKFHNLSNLNLKLCKMRKVLHVFNSKTSPIVRWCTINLYTTKKAQVNDVSLFAGCMLTSEMSAYWERWRACILESLKCSKDMCLVEWRIEWMHVNS